MLSLFFLIPRPSQACVRLFPTERGNLLKMAQSTQAVQYMVINGYHLLSYLFLRTQVLSGSAASFSRPSLETMVEVASKEASFGREGKSFQLRALVYVFYLALRIGGGSVNAVVKLIRSAIRHGKMSSGGT